MAGDWLSWTLGVTSLLHPELYIQYLILWTLFFILSRFVGHTLWLVRLLWLRLTLIQVPSCVRCRHDILILTSFSDSLFLYQCVMTMPISLRLVFLPWRGVTVEEFITWTAQSFAFSYFLVYCDNVSVVNLSFNLVQHQRTKHIEIDIHFVRDLVTPRQVRILHVPSRYQYADIFIKGLPTALVE